MGGSNLYNDIAKGENTVERSNDTAIKAFNDKYKVGNDRFGEGVRYMTGSNGKAGVFAQSGNNGQTVTVHTPTDETALDSQFRLNVSNGDLDHRNYRGADKSTILQNLSKVNPGMANRFNDAYDEVENYNNGNYYYDNGWKLKESRIHQIVSESIDKVLGRR